MDVDVRIRAIDFELTPPINDYTEERLVAVQHVIGASEAARCKVELGRAVGSQRHGEDVWFAAINLYESGQHFFARAEGASINAAIDGVKDEILAQLRKRKKVDKGLLKRSGALVKRLLRRE